MDHCTTSIEVCGATREDGCFSFLSLVPHLTRTQKYGLIVCRKGMTFNQDQNCLLWTPSWSKKSLTWLLTGTGSYEIC